MNPFQTNMNHQFFYFQIKWTFICSTSILGYSLICAK